jgi:hypothetical protein
MEDRTSGLCSVRAGHYFIMDRFRFFNVYKFQCSNSSTIMVRHPTLATRYPDT